MIEIDVRGRARALASRTERSRLVRRLERAMEAASVSGSELSLSLVDDDEIRALNRDFRDEDKPTDVLSFSMQEDGEPPHEGQTQPVTPAPMHIPGTLELLGDIVISVETAMRQAEARSVDLHEELLHLAVHGLAHLLGYDHASSDEERVMFGWETLLREQAAGRAPVRVVPAP